MKESQNRISGIEVTRSVIEIVSRKKYLGGVPPMDFQGSIVSFDQSTLANRGDSLQMGQINWTLGQFQPADASPDGAAAHQHHASFAFQQLHELLCQFRYPLLVERTILVG
jgi:hypothetical protein